MGWTKQQQEAIDTRDRSIIVSAAAGSGKTSVLVERLLQILSDPSPNTRVPVERIIVVTFTKDAAAQMKHKLTHKISEAIDEMSRKGKHQEPAYKWLTQQRTALSNAKISTIHSFCFDFIRENADACGISSQFSIIDSAREYVYRKRAMQSVLERHSREHREETELLYNYFCIKSDEDLEVLIQDTAKYLNSLAFPEYWLKQARAFCENENAYFLERVKEELIQEIQGCIALAEKSRETARDAYDKSDDRKYELILNSDIQKMQEHQQAIQELEAEELLTNPEARQIRTFDKLPNVRGEKHEAYLDEEQKKVFQQLREFYKEQYKKAVNRLFEPLKFWEEDEAIQRQVLPILLNLTEQYREGLFAEKQKQNVLSFDDAEHLVLKLLGKVDEKGRIQRSELAKTVSENYSLIMVDEYQDSNNKQDSIFKLLSENCRFSADGKTAYYGTNAFVVGDVKQSIYRFRQANPENFRRTIQDSVMLEDCQHTEEMARIYLNQNFRSASGILRFINELFSSVMSEKCGGLVYDSHEQLNFGAEAFGSLKADAQGVQILFPEDSIETESEDVQAECIADTIKTMIEQKIPVMHDEGEKECTYQDFCILMRSLKHADAICEAFRKRNIPFICDNDSNFLTLPEIRFMINLLKVIDNPMTDMSMAAVLLSPVYGFTPEDLAMLKVSGTGRRIYLQMQSMTEEEHSELSRKCTAFLHQLAEMRSMRDTMPLEKFIYEVYDMTDLLSLQSLEEDAGQRRNHLEVFVQYAQSYREHADLTAQSSLSGWLRYLNYLAESEEEIDAGGGNQKADYVSIKTIHGSKGLEYPFIFLMHPERPFRYKPPTSNVLMEENGMLGLKMVDRRRYLKIESAVWTYLNYHQEREDKSEEMRLLYVALTRAKQKLFITMDKITSEHKLMQMGDFLNQNPSVVPIIAAGAGSMQEWIMAYLLSSEEAEAFKEAVNGHDADSDTVEYRIWKLSEHRFAPEEKEEISTEPDEEMMKKIEAQFGYVYKSPLIELPAKRTVTSLSHQEAEHAERSEVPEFMQEDEEGRIRKLYGAARGTAIHKIMQFMDFEAANENLAQELERLQEAKLLEPIEVKAIQSEKIMEFFGSELYRRIALSDNVQKEKQLFVQIGKLNLPEKSMLWKQYHDTDGILIGTVDLLFHEEDGWVIVDYKTDRVKEAEELTEKYALQLGLYQKAMELILGEPIKQALIYSFGLSRAIEVDLSGLTY